MSLIDSNKSNSNIGEYPGIVGPEPVLDIRTPLNELYKSTVGVRGRVYYTLVEGFKSISKSIEIIVNTFKGRGAKTNARVFKESARIQALESASLIDRRVQESASLIKRKGNELQITEYKDLLKKVSEDSLKLKTVAPLINKACKKDHPQLQKHFQDLQNDVQELQDTLLRAVSPRVDYVKAAKTNAPKIHLEKNYYANLAKFRNKPSESGYPLPHKELVVRDEDAILLNHNRILPRGSKVAKSRIKDAEFGKPSIIPPGTPKDKDYEKYIADDDARKARLDQVRRARIAKKPKTSASKLDSLRSGILDFVKVILDSIEA